MNRPKLMLASFVCSSGNVLKMLSRADRNRDTSCSRGTGDRGRTGPWRRTPRRSRPGRAGRTRGRSSSRAPAPTPLSARSCTAAVPFCCGTAVLEAIFCEATKEERAELCRVSAELLLQTRRDVHLGDVRAREVGRRRERQRAVARIDAVVERRCRRPWCRCRPRSRRTAPD